MYTGLRGCRRHLFSIFPSSQIRYTSSCLEIRDFRSNTLEVYRTEYAAMYLCRYLRSVTLQTQISAPLVNGRVAFVLRTSNKYCLELLPWECFELSSAPLRNSSLFSLRKADQIYWLTFISVRCQNLSDQPSSFKLWIHLGSLYFYTMMLAGSGLY